jgi:hypothetical protein
MSRSGTGIVLRVCRPDQTDWDPELTIVSCPNRWPFRAENLTRGPALYAITGLHILRVHIAPEPPQVQLQVLAGHARRHAAGERVKDEVAAPTDAGPDMLDDLRRLAIRMSRRRTSECVPE